jgi:hypothetical protein
MKRGFAQPVKFVDQDAAGLPVKRKQVHQACELCKRRKVRIFVTPPPFFLSPLLHLATG